MVRLITASDHIGDIGPHQSYIVTASNHRCDCIKLLIQSITGLANHQQWVGDTHILTSNLGFIILAELRKADSHSVSW